MSNNRVYTRAKWCRLAVGAAFLISPLSCLLTTAQSTLSQRQVYAQAEADYEIGRIEAARDSLLSHLSALRGMNRQNALRLVALSYLARFDIEQTEHYASLLLQENPYYTPTAQDPATFVDVINKIKGGQTATITTASSIKETAVEAPAPIIIITAEMIENLGYNKRLGQILATYVPGMSSVYKNGLDNMAMHGAYASTQELILVMENGHRLNNRFDNSSSMDYDISTDKIDHIEVLRGPASSLYGNVSLSAVVNIITKSGGELNGVKLKYGHGAFGTHRADLTMGTRWMDADILVWGGFYQSDGQHRAARDAAEYKEKYKETMPTEYYSYVDGYRDTPTYDIGMTLRYKGFDLQMERKNSKKLRQYAEYSFYDYDRYRNISGMRPGLLTQLSAIQLGYTTQLGPVTLRALAFGDWHTTADYALSSSVKIDPSMSWLPEGNFDYSRYSDRTLGGNLQGTVDYKVGSMKGSLLAGAWFEHFSMTDYYAGIGENYSGSMTEGNSSWYFDTMKHENSWALYVQAKHYFTPRVILNAGLRHDIRYRMLFGKFTNLSPRLALILMPREAFNVKLSFSKAFVDKSYSDRIQQTETDTPISPQYLSALQLQVTGRIAPLNLTYDVNLFYNQYENLLSFRQDYGANASNGIDDFTNEGKYRNIGLELCLAYSHRRLTANANFYWQRVLKAENYFYSENENAVLAVPKTTANLNVAYKLLDKSKHELKIYGNAKYTGTKTLTKTVSDWNNTDDWDGTEFDWDGTESSWEGTGFDWEGTESSWEGTESGQKKQDYFLNSTFVIDAGIKYTYKKRLSLSIDCENLMDTDRFLSGPSYVMYPYYERGRNLMISVSYKF